jgi:plastocyanin
MEKLIITSLISLSVASMLHAKDVVVDQKNKTFIPHAVTLEVGDNLVFLNHDGFAHNAYTDDEANEFDIGMQSPGEVKKVRMKAPGKFDVECAIHPNMLLEVTVE